MEEERRKWKEERGEDKGLMKAVDNSTNYFLRLINLCPSQVAGMGALPVVLLLCGFHVFTAGAQTGPTPAGALSSDCREEMYPCTRMYSVHRPMKKCVAGFCLYSLQRMYVINNEICTRTVCPQDEYLKANLPDTFINTETGEELGSPDAVTELCRERSGWPRRTKRSSNQRRRCRRRGNPNTWANKV